MTALFGLLGIPALLMQPVIKPPIEWIQANVDLTNDPTSAANGLVVLDPYQLEPILAQFDSNIHEIVVMAPPQTGKSFCWRLPLLYKVMYIDGPRWIIYESDDKAEDINAQQFDPLMRAVPELAARLADAGRYSAVKRQYRFPTGPVDFSGAGSEPTSKPERDGVADELDTWPIPDASKRKTLASFRDRFVTWWRKGEGCLVIVSSPNGQNSAIGHEYERTSKGSWHLRCLGCRELTMPSSRVDNLQWESTPDGAVIAASILLICPRCNHAHDESMAVAMNQAGGYLHQYPEVRRRGFQWGALASPRTRSWPWVAEMQMLAGSKATLDELENFAKVVRGLPYKPKSVRRDQVDAIRAHCGPALPAEKLCAVFFAADTQDKGFWWVVRGIDEDRNTALLANGYANNFAELRAAWDAKYLGLLPIMGIIDEGGHRGREVVEFVGDKPGLYTYKGDNRIVRWVYQKGDRARKRVLANAKFYQSDLLYYLYSQDKRDGNYWYLPQNVDDEYVAQIGAMRPDNKVRNGNLFENYTVPDGIEDHFFDAEKMIRVAIDIAEEELKRPAQWHRPPPWLFGARKTSRRKSGINME